jgi:large subunit ribosomal protein L21
MFAVIKTGGKQYRVAADRHLRSRKLRGSRRNRQFREVLMLGGDAPKVGAPLVAGRSVLAEIIGQKRGRKIIVFKKRRRQNSRRRNGHRQDITLVRITDILAAGQQPGERQVRPVRGMTSGPADNAGSEITAPSAEAGSAGLSASNE